jgi:hypothetical protein
MLSFPNAKSAIDTQHNLQTSQKVMLEWNYNIHAGITEMGIDDSALYSYDEETGDLKVIETSTNYDRYKEEVYPLTSVVSFIRPGEYAVHNGTYVGGILKGIYGAISAVTTSYTNPIRNYFVSKDDGYKYWALLRKGQSSTAVNKSIYAKYDRSFKTNKIVVKFETAHSTPKKFKVYGFKNNAWTQLFAYDNTNGLTAGGLIIYYNGTTWSTTKHTSPSISTNVDTISGIKVLVETVNVGYYPLEIIEISPRLEADVSADVVSWSIQKNLFEDGGVLPVGQISSNSASVAFDNTLNDFSYEKESAKYYGILDKRVGVKIYSIIGSDVIPQFTGFMDSWSISPNTTASVECYDMAKILQQTTAPDMVIGPKYTIGKAMRTAFDAIGLNEAIINVENSLNETVGTFWMSNEQTFWDTLQQLCVSYQSAVFFDEVGRPVFKAKGNVLDAQTTEQLLTYNKSGTTLPNILNFEQSAKPRIGNLVVKYAARGYEVQNDVLTTYNAAQSSTNKDAVIGFRGASYATTIWEPPTEWTLGATRLAYAIPMGTADIQIKVPSTQQIIQKNSEPKLVIADGIISYKGYLYINGEIIYYDGTKFLVQYNDGRGQEEKKIQSKEEYQSLIASDPGIAFINHTGKLTGVKRGQFGTTEKAHSAASPDNGAWSIRTAKVGTASSTFVNNPTFSIENSALRLSTDNTSGKSTLKETKPAERRKNIQLGLVTLKKDNYKRFETTMRIVLKEPTEVDNDTDSLGGIAIDYNESNNSGYFIEFALGATVESYGKANANKTINIYKLTSGVRTNIASIDSVQDKFKRDSENTVFKDSVSFETVQDYDIQVLRIERNKKMCLDLYIMGQLICQVEDSTPLPRTTKAGVFVAGDSTAFFSKFGAWGANDSGSLQDGAFFADSIRGFTTEVVAAGYLGAVNKPNQDNTYDYYEFYPVIREIRIEEFDYLKFPATPVKIAAGASITRYGATILSSNSFRAKIALINESTFPTSLSSSFPGTATAQYPKLIGYALKKFDAKEYKISISKARSDDAKFEVDSEWIQSYDQAKGLADFIKSKSSVVKNGKTNDVINVNVEIFSNPLVQLGDTVDVEHPDLGLSSSTHSFIVTGISQSFQDGLTTSLTLQEVS